MREAFELRGLIDSIWARLQKESPEVLESFATWIEARLTDRAPLLESLRAIERGDVLPNFAAREEQNQSADGLPNYDF